MRCPARLIALILSLLLIAGCNAGSPAGQQPLGATEPQQNAAANKAPGQNQQTAPAAEELQKAAVSNQTLPSLAERQPGQFPCQIPGQTPEEAPKGVSGNQTQATPPAQEQQHHQNQPGQAAAQAQTAAQQPLPEPASIKPAPEPFPDDGKTANWQQSSKYPAYACHNSSLPQQLYTYSFDQGNTDSFKISLVKPIDFYCQTSADLRQELLTFYKDFLTAYYTADPEDIDAWANRLRGYFDPKMPVAKVNNLDPDAFVQEKINNTADKGLTSTLTTVLTDESLIYLDTNAHYRVRGRVTLQENAAADPQSTPDTYAWDVEVAFKKKLLAGPDNWANKDYIVTALVKLR